MNNQANSEYFREGGLPLRSQVESLKQKLIDRNITIVQMETKMAQEMPHVYSHGQLATLRATCDSWQDKYERLLEAHKRLQRVNQGLEDKLLRLVDRSESEKARLSQDATNLTTALTTAAQAINRLKNENTRNQKDLGLAIQLLQCNPSQYASHKLDMLPPELHQKVKSRLGPDGPKAPKTEAKVIRVPIPTFPPTAMVYSVNKCSEEKEKEEPVDVVSAAIMAAILEERERERSQRHCPTCTCQLETQSKSSTNFSNDNGSSINNNGGTNDSKHADSTSRYFATPGGASKDDSNNKESSSTFTPSAGLQFDVKAIDVGTQTLPSYIGESGKVTSTCIYCQSVKTLSEINIHANSNGECPGRTHSCSSKKKTHFDGSCSFPKGKSERKRLSSSTGGSCSWDWHTESQDSGSPSTPTSLTSTSLSYESETSCLTSPQDSPGHVSLHSVNTLLKGAEGPSLVKAEERSPQISSEFGHSKPTACRNSVMHAKDCKTTINPSSRGTKGMKECNGEKVLKKTRSTRTSIPEQENLWNDFKPLALSSSPLLNDVFTPIHLSTSERYEPLSDSDSEGFFTDSTTSSKIVSASHSPPQRKISLVASSKESNEVGYSALEDAVKTDTVPREESPVEPIISMNMLKEILQYKDIFLKDTYIGKKFESEFPITKPEDHLPEPVVISSTFTSSATETTL